MKLCEEFTQC